VSAADYTNGAGAFTLFPILALDDGTVLWLKSVGTGTVDGTKTNFAGTRTVGGGKGRYDGAKGDGTLKVARYTPLSVDADLVSDCTVKIKKWNLAYFERLHSQSLRQDIAASFLRRAKRQGLSRNGAELSR